MNAIPAVLMLALLAYLLTPHARRLARELVDGLLDSSRIHCALRSRIEPAAGSAADELDVPEWVNDPASVDRSRSDLELRLLGARYLQAQGERDAQKMASIDSVLGSDDLLAALAMNAEVLALQVAILRGCELGEALAGNVDAAVGMLYGQSAA